MTAALPPEGAIRICNIFYYCGVLATLLNDMYAFDSSISDVNWLSVLLAGLSLTGSQTHAMLHGR